MMKTNEDRNGLGFSEGLEFSESDSNALEGSGGAQSLGVWLVWCQSLRGWLERSWRSSRGLILDRTGSQQLDGDLNNLTHLKDHVVLTIAVFLQQTYTLRSELPEYSSGGLIFSLICAMTESSGVSS